MQPEPSGPPVIGMRVGGGVPLNRTAGRVSRHSITCSSCLPSYSLTSFLGEIGPRRRLRRTSMDEPFIFRVTAEEVQLLGRRLQAGDQIAVYPRRGVLPVLDCPPPH